MAANGSGCRHAARGCWGSVLTSAAAQPPERRSRSVFKTRVKTQACSRDRGGTTVPRRAGQAFLGAAISGPAMSRGNMGSSQHSPGHKRVTSRLLFPYSCSPLPWELCPTSCSSKKKGTAMGRCCQHPHPPQHKRQPAELRSWKQHLKELRGKTALTATRPGWGANVRAGSLRTGLTTQRSHPWEWR